MLDSLPLVLIWGRDGEGKGVIWGGGDKRGGVEGAFLPFSDANERRNGFPAFSLQSVSPLQHAPLPGHCGRTKLQARDPIT